MRASAFAWLGLLAAPLLLLAAPAAARAASFEDAVLAEINDVRAHPQAYARQLRHEQLHAARYYGEEGYGVTRDDPEAVDDAIAFLMRQSPLRPLARDPRLAAAARVHASRQGRTGGVGHGAPGALGARLRAQGLFAGIEAESISYGQRSPQDVVRQLVVDSGVPGRGHRRDLFGQAFQAAGVACGPHAEWGAMCVIDYAGAIVRR
ncbi:MAG TPA: CAP domain-containing protein [Phenylobacterium sp.]|uniref:CAP domain-containing protein n=1 Tax=Phenylobacterium sp. TaxID=1871053 RepID=UPI002B48E017|nr:CAP domain-containing protein [Phenylobacterium sp.]HKR88678.1 CAP domain-containing protein [Phenylobacterium sp.]